MAQNTDYLKTEPNENPIDNTGDLAFIRSCQLRNENEGQNSENTINWENAQAMYDDCFRGEDDPYAQNNPILLKNTIDRGKENYRLVDYILRIPGSTFEERQILRDMITQIEGTSGLTQAMRDDPRGNFSQFLFGNSIYMWGKNTDPKKQDTPIIFQNVRLTQAFFSFNALMLRSANGYAGAKEALFIFERTYDEQIDLYGDKAKNAGMGKIPNLFAENDVQKAELTEQESKIQLTQDAHYYNINKGIYKIYVGHTATIVKEFSDEDPNLHNYPFKINGKNEIPAIFLRTFGVTDSIWSKGFYDLFGKTARNSAWRKSRARQYVDKNINPPTFIKMKEENYAEFQNQVDLQAEARLLGEDAYINISPDDEVVTSDMRTNPLSNEFERLKGDDLEDATQSGIAIQDVQQPVSKKATVATFEERNKNRLTFEIVKNNAQEGKFIRELIVDFIRRFVKKGNKTPVATNLKIKLDPTPTDLEEAQRIAETQGIPLDAAIQQITKEVSADGVITYGDVAEMLRKKFKHVTIQEDFSSYGDIGFKFSNLETQLQIAAGSPVQADIQKEMLSLLGRDVLNQDIQQNQGLTAKQAGDIKAPDLQREPQTVSPRAALAS